MEYKTTTKTEAKHIVAEAKVNHDTILQNKRRR